jgi:ribonuclease P protein component
VARFPRPARLTEPAEFKRVFDGCRCKASDRHFTALAIPNDRESPRLGLVVSRKAARRAVARNRIKRQIRESFRHSQARLGGLDIVVIARQGIDERDNKVLALALETLWTRLIKTCAGS